MAYRFTAGDGKSWQRGSNSGLRFTVSRDPDDGQAFSLFTGAEIDGKAADPARYTAESPLQLQMLSDWADAHGKTLRVYPRLTNKSQFGMDEDTICDLIANREKYPHIEFAGIHFFSGTQKKKLKKHEKELQMLDAFFARLAEEAGFTVPELEYGTGFAVSYFEDQKKDEDLRDPDNLALFGQMVRDMQWKGIVTIEMGRAYAAECGCYVTTALDIKQCSAGVSLLRSRWETALCSTRPVLTASTRVCRFS